MAITSQEIINSIEKDYPTENQLKLQNISDLNFQTDGKWLNQYIIGVTHKDYMGSGVEHYKHRMGERLAKVSSHFKCLAWAFYDYEENELKITLTELSNYFEADLDVPRMISNLRMKRDNGEFYYLVITIVQHPILYVS